MADHNVREIQLGGKQLVFLFMASVVLAVAIFLLGISVGRGAGSPGETPASAELATAPSPQSPPADMPPPTETTPVDLSYHDKLQGQSAPPPEPTPAGPAADPAPAAPPAGAPPEMTPPSTTGAGRSQPPASAAVQPTPPEKPAPKPAPTPRGTGWFVQVNAFRSKENADRQVVELKSKGYSAASVLSDPPGSLFRVRLGQAERVAQRLVGEGMKPSIQR
jgi:cell division septation protein DedD